MRNVIAARNVDPNDDPREHLPVMDDATHAAWAARLQSILDVAHTQGFAYVAVVMGNAPDRQGPRRVTALCGHGVIVRECLIEAIDGAIRVSRAAHPEWTPADTIAFAQAYLRTIGRSVLGSLLEEVSE